LGELEPRVLQRQSDSREGRNGRITLAGRILRSRRILIPFLAALACLCSTSAFGQAQNPFLGQLALVPYDYAPVGWALCNGQVLPIAQNTALFSLIGTRFGGNGVTTFALPDLRGRVPISSGQAPGLSNYPLGAVGGLEQVALSEAQMPAHTHEALCDTTVATTDRPANMIPARNAAAAPQYGAVANAAMDGAAIAPAGGGQPHENRQPYLTLNWIIATQGSWPNHP
jgi:microcystin-dependent protein